MSVIITHNAGFFSCCAVKLNGIVDFINSHSTLPDIVDSSAQFELYKTDNAIDVTYEYFEHYDKIDVSMNYPINYHYTHQFSIYENLDSNIAAVVKKYFSPSQKIITISNLIKQKYNIDYDNSIAVYYRGTDKYTETELASFDNFYNKIIEIRSFDEHKTIIIQTDSSQFVDFITSKNLTNIVILNEASTSYSDLGIHLQKTSTENYYDMLNIFSIFLILSKCKYLICCSSNGSNWIVFYRENCNGVHQFLNGKWYNTV